MSGIWRGRKVATRSDIISTERVTGHSVTPISSLAGRVDSMPVERVGDLVHQVRRALELAPALAPHAKTRERLGRPLVGVRQPGEAGLALIPWGRVLHL